MRTISQRELRNDSGAVMRGVEEGESFLVTRRGVPIARLVPLTGGDLPCDRPARSRPRFQQLRRVTSSAPTADLLDDLRAER